MSKLIADALYAKIEPLADILEAAWRLHKDSPTPENNITYEKARVAYNNAMSEFNRAEAVANSKRA